MMGYHAAYMIEMARKYETDPDYRRQVDKEKLEKRWAKEGKKERRIILVFFMAMVGLCIFVGCSDEKTKGTNPNENITSEPKQTSDTIVTMDTTLRGIQK